MDAFGGDNAPAEILKGCRMAADELGVQIILTGSAEKIRAAAAQNAVEIADFEIIDCPDVITMEDEATDIMRAKKESSMAVGLRALAEGRGDAFASAGNSGAIVVGATLIVKRIKGVKRVAFAPLLPKSEGFFMLCDGGANNECRPEMLAQFGLMGSVYMQKVMGLQNARVGLANVGTEAQGRRAAAGGAQAACGAGGHPLRRQHRSARDPVRRGRRGRLRRLHGQHAAQDVRGRRAGADG